MPVAPVRLNLGQDISLVPQDVARFKHSEGPSFLKKRRAGILGHIASVGDDSVNASSKEGNPSQNLWLAWPDHYHFSSLAPAYTSSTGETIFSAIQKVFTMKE